MFDRPICLIALVYSLISVSFSYVTAAISGEIKIIIKMTVIGHQGPSGGIRGHLVLISTFNLLNN